MDMLMDMDSSTNVGTHLSYTYSSSVWCAERFESCIHHDSSSLNTSACIFKNKGLFLHNHDTMVKFKKLGIVTILLFYTQCKFNFYQLSQYCLFFFQMVQNPAQDHTFQVADKSFYSPSICIRPYFSLSFIKLMV